MHIRYQVAFSLRRLCVEIKQIESETKILSDISNRLKTLEKQLDSASDSSTLIHDADEIQILVSKMTTLRDLIDRIEVEISNLDSRATDIESLKFKRQTQTAFPQAQADLLRLRNDQ